MTNQDLKEIADHMSHSNLPMFEEVFPVILQIKNKYCKYSSEKKISSKT